MSAAWGCMYDIVCSSNFLRCLSFISFVCVFLWKFSPQNFFWQLLIFIHAEIRFNQLQIVQSQAVTICLSFCISFSMNFMFSHLVLSFHRIFRHELWVKGTAFEIVQNHCGVSVGFWSGALCLWFMLAMRNGLFLHTLVALKKKKKQTKKQAIWHTGKFIRNMLGTSLHFYNNTAHRSGEKNSRTTLQEAALAIQLHVFRSYLESNVWSMFLKFEIWMWILTCFSFCSPELQLKRAKFTWWFGHSGANLSANWTKRKIGKPDSDTNCSKMEILFLRPSSHRTRSTLQQV